VAELKKTVGLFDAFAIGLGAIIGAGIFVVLGVASGVAGPALIFSLIIGAVVSAFTAISFAELAAFMPLEGGGYEFAHALVSPFAGFVSGWMWLFANLVSGAVVAIGFASYLAIVIPLPVNLMAGVACLAIVWVNYAGVKDSARVNDVLVVVKVVILIFFVIIGMFGLASANFTPFAPHGIGGIMEGAALIFFAYAGFSRVTMISEEVEDPKRTIPKAIILALVVSTVIYLAVSVVAIGLVGSASLASSGSPIAVAAQQESAAAAILVAVAALAATLSVLLTTLLGLSRIGLAMARNGDLPKIFARLHPRRSTPYISILVFGGIMTLFALFSDILVAAAISNFGALVYYALADVAAMRLKNPTYSRVFPPIGFITCAMLLFFLDPIAWLLGGAVLAACTIYYFMFRVE
jgi:APA family basic amino acid/polyamine antiporter